MLDQSAHDHREAERPGSPTATTPPPGKLSSRGLWASISENFPGFFAFMVFLNGLLTGFLALAGVEFRDQHFEIVETVGMYIDIQANIAWATVLMLNAAALAARKRAAWALSLLWTVLFFAMDIGDYVYEDALNWGPLAFHSVVILLLVATRKEFWTRVRKVAYLRALGTLFAGLAICIPIGWGLLELDPGQVPPEQRLDWTIIQVAGLGIEQGGYSESPAPGWVTFIQSSLGALCLITAIVVIFRTRRAEDQLSEADEQAIRVLVERHGSADSLSYFALRRDKSVVFSPDGFAAVAYRVEAGVSIASGDPLGDPKSWPAAIEAWMKAARPYGWVPAAIGTSRAGAEAYHQAGFSVLDLGDEAIVHTGRFSLRGAERAPLRRAVGHAEKAGVKVRMRRHADVPTEELARLGQLADEWRGDEPERGFSMALGRWNDPADGECLLAEAVIGMGTPEEQVVGLLSFVPWGRAGVSLDVMRRSPDAPNGTTELMITDLCRRADEVGVRRVSLNFAMFRSVFEEGAEIGAGPVLRLWRRILVFLSRWWQMESLYRSNLKYQPDWEPRFLCFQDGGQLPRIGLGVGIAEGFVGMPRPFRPLRGDAAVVSSNAPDLSVFEVEEQVRRYPEQERIRREKADHLIDSGVDPWPMSKPPSHEVKDVDGLEEGARLSVSGRALGIRDFGGVIFVELCDWTGRTQLLLDRQVCGEAMLEAFRTGVDLGDLIGVSGRRGKSRKGEPSVLVDMWRMEAKCLHPMPDKWRGLTDPEALVRQRYLDLAVNTKTRERMRARSAVLTSLRSTLGSYKYLEVETPILQTIHGGANARPFRTHINAYDLDLYLRIAPELYLKRLCVGGMDRVFELGRTFRNEGVDFSHNPEFTILEAYAAHGDYLTMMDLCRELIQNAAIAANGECVVPGPNGERVDISGEWPVKTLHGAISEALVEMGGREITADTPVEILREQCDLAGVPYLSGWDAGTVALEMYERLVEEHTQRPTFYCDFPVSVSPLTRSHRSTPGVTERWDLVAWGVELGTAYSELTDPLEQRRRLTAQSESAAAGDPEAMELDEDFLVALEHGMPPTGGLGMGVDRLVMMITGASIRETLPFPMARPR
ncbi:lysyl-tRNA synthetase, class II [Austwickia chelonae]|uniref:Lysine--tRNA ligase n=1 Tax=Austwickia chelonae NBRC 105200 TaxID=1184607 RepID=K6V8Y7_9MICO|nr:bifunctional lysylphosphatidylglycerol synthetase/lysine--tRNA ligase LysX [Austwickia chelonae]GAB78688.1 putative lysyl-tRNA synthetase [Austwickia chelonae NBRC 105200]SEW34732.1 lysyl-tRNA synthetase, class II [Austwickia chelonae]